MLPMALYQRKTLHEVRKSEQPRYFILIFSGNRNTLEAILIKFGHYHAGRIAMDNLYE